MPGKWVRLHDCFGGEVTTLSVGVLLTIKVVENECWTWEWWQTCLKDLWVSSLESCTRLTLMIFAINHSLPQVITHAPQSVSLMTIVRHVNFSYRRANETDSKSNVNVNFLRWCRLLETTLIMVMHLKWDMVMRKQGSLNKARSFNYHRSMTLQSCNKNTIMSYLHLAWHPACHSNQSS